jgi:chromosome segregation ATPase
MLNTLYQKKSGDWIAKKAVLTVKADVEGHGSKRVGKLSLNLADYRERAVSNQQFNLDSSFDKFSKIVISIRATALGEAGVPDNMSDISGGSGFSMGTEGEYTGPVLSHDQDLTGYEEDKRIVPGTMGRPPAVIRQPGALRMPAFTGPINPQRISETINSQADRAATEQKLKEFKAQTSLLERENTQLKAERDEMKLQVNFYEDSQSKGHQRFEDQITALEKALKDSETAKGRMKELLAKYKEELQKQERVKQELVAETEKMQQSAVVQASEKERISTDLNSLRQQLAELKEKQGTTERENASLQKDKARLENEVNVMEAANNQLLGNLQRLREELAESRDALSSRGSETDEASVTYRRKTESVINQLKAQVQETDQARQDAVDKHARVIREIKQHQQQITKSEKEHAAIIAKLEAELHDLKEDNSELITKIEEEKASRAVLERKFKGQASELEAKLDRLTGQKDAAEAEKQQLEQTLAELERSYKKRSSSLESDSAAQQLTKQRLEALEQEVTRYKKQFADREAELAESMKRQAKLEQYVEELRQQLIRATSSDSPSSILGEQVHTLEAKLADMEYTYSVENSQLQDRIAQLEVELEVLDKQKKQQVAQLERELTRLKSTQQAYSQEDESVESLKQALQLARMESADLKEDFCRLEGETKRSEQILMETKMVKANSQLENDTLQQKYREAQERLREFSSQYTMMEVELYKVNERFGQMINMNNELELEVVRLRKEQEAPKKKKRFGS